MFGFPLISIGFGCLVLAALSPRSLVGQLKVPGANFVATLSFACYLTQKSVIHFVQPRLAANNVDPKGVACFLFTAIACAAASAALYFLVERPCLSLRDRILSAHLRLDNAESMAIRNIP